MKLICNDKTIVEMLVSKGIKRADLFNQKTLLRFGETLLKNTNYT